MLSQFLLTLVLTSLAIAQEMSLTIPSLPTDLPPSAASRLSQVLTQITFDAAASSQLTAQLGCLHDSRSNYCAFTAAGLDPVAASYIEGRITDPVVASAISNWESAAGPALAQATNAAGSSAAYRNALSAIPPDQRAVLSSIVNAVVAIETGGSPPANAAPRAVDLGNGPLLVLAGVAAVVLGLTAAL